MAIRDSVVSDRPPDETQLKDGDREIYLDGQNLVEVIKVNGVLFENIIGGDQSEPVLASGSGGIGNWESLDDGLYAGNLELLSDDAVLIAKDADGDARAKFGQVATNSFGLQVLSENGSAELMGFYGSTATIAGWTINTTSIFKTITSAGVTKSVGLTTNASKPGFTVQIGSIERIRLGFLDTTEYGMKIKDSTGANLVEIKADDDGGTADVATIAGWTISPTALTGGSTSTTIALVPGTAIWMGDASLSSAKFSVTNAGVLKATSGTIGGWDLTDTVLRSATSGSRIQLDKGKNRISIFDGTDETIVMGFLDGVHRNDASGNANSANATTLVHTGKDWKNDELNGLTIKFTSGNASGNTSLITDTTGGDTITYNTMSPAPEAGDAYQVLYGDSDYGFWAQNGDYLQIDGDVEYLNGDWLISHNASLRIFNETSQEVLRLGSANNGEKGLFLYDGTGSLDSDLLAKFHTTGFQIGDVDGADNNISYALDTGVLAIKGSFTVQDAVLPALAFWVKNAQWDSSFDNTFGSSPVAVAGADTYHATNYEGEAIIFGYSGNGTYDATVNGAFMYEGSKYIIERFQGWTTNTGETQDKKTYAIATAAPSSGVLDGYIVYETIGGTTAQPVVDGAQINCPFYMGGVTGDPYFRMAFCTRTTTVATDGTISVVWKYDPNSINMTTFTPTSTMVVIGYMRTIEYDKIEYMQMFREAIPIDTVQDAGGWTTTNFNADGTSAILNSPGVTITGGGITMSSGGSIKGGQTDYNTGTGFFLGYSGGAYKFSIGKTSTNNITWSGSVMSIRGSLNADDMTTGSIESSDGNTKFDLDEDVIIINDDSHDRVALGDIGDSGYGLKISAPGSTAVSADDDDLFLSSNWAVPKFTLLFGGANEKIDGSGLLDTAYTTWVTGTCTANDSPGTSMQDTSKDWEVNEWVGSTVVRTNAGVSDATSMRAYGQITANDSDTLTHVALAGGYPSTGDDWDIGDTYTISPKMWGRYAKSDSYYVGTKKQISSPSNLTWTEDTEGTTIATFPYLHDKINKYIRLSAFLSAETSLRLGIYRQTWNTGTAQKLQLELAGVEDKGRFFYTTSFINALNTGDAVWSDDLNTTSAPLHGQPAWYVCTDGGIASGDFASIGELQIGLAQGNLNTHFDEIYDRFPFTRIINTNANNGSYEVATLDLTSHLSAANPLKHGDLYIIRLTGGRTSSSISTDDSHLVIQPQVTVHGYDFNATDGDNSS